MSRGSIRERQSSKSSFTIGNFLHSFNLPFVIMCKLNKTLSIIPKYNRISSYKSQSIRAYRRFPQIYFLTQETQSINFHCLRKNKPSRLDVMSRLLCSTFTTNKKYLTFIHTVLPRNQRSNQPSKSICFPKDQFHKRSFGSLWTRITALNFISRISYSNFNCVFVQVIIAVVFFSSCCH